MPNTNTVPLTGSSSRTACKHDRTSVPLASQNLFVHFFGPLFLHSSILVQKLQYVSTLPWS